MTEMHVCVCAGLAGLHAICFMLEKVGMKNHYKTHSINIQFINIWGELLLWIYITFLPVHFCCSYSPNFPSYFSFIHKY